MFKAILAAAAVSLAPAAAMACNINAIVGTYEVQVTRDTADRTTYHTTCWFEVSRKNASVGNLRISCADTGDPYGFFGLEGRPWHQLHKVPGRIGVADSVRRVNPCRWQLIDLNQVEDIAYNVTFSGDGQSLVGLTPNVFHVPSDNYATFALTGVRQ